MLTGSQALHNVPLKLLLRSFTLTIQLHDLVLDIFAGGSRQDLLLYYAHPGGVPSLGTC